MRDLQGIFKRLVIFVWEHQFSVNDFQHSTSVKGDFFLLKYIQNGPFPELNETQQSSGSYQNG